MRLGPAAAAVEIAVALFLLAAASAEGLPLSLSLERALPRRGVAIDELVKRDSARHGRRLAARFDGVVDFPVEGAANPFTVGLYFTRVKLGNPPKEFSVQIDTGSDILWVTCNPCSGCPTSSGLNIPLDFFDPERSSSASKITCSDDRCTTAMQTGEAICTSGSSTALCDYTFQYGDGSGTSGYYVSDTLFFDTVTGNEQTVNSSAEILFGCSNSQSGDLRKADRAVGGIFGFGQHELSVVSQLHDMGVGPKVFSHCLRGSDNGGGVLVLGEIIEPGIVYTPLVPSQPHYNLNLQSISVNGQTLAIDPSVFTTTDTQGTIVDSGTTLAYLAEKVYDPFVSAITSSIASSVRPVVAKGNQCYVTSESVDAAFPSVTLQFEGGAALVLKPEEYLLQQGFIDTSALWCIGWQKNQGQGITILGDIALKDKIFVYDLANQRIGWTDYDCSLSVNVSTTSGKNEYLNAGQLDVSGSSSTACLTATQTITVILLVHIVIIAFLHR